MDIAAYYFPNYHRDSRNEKRHGKGWTEWELMKCARPRFEGHRQPIVPAWGYQDEADPAVMAAKIDAAVAHHVDTFIFDWYWYDGSFLQRALDEGFLSAKNNSKMKFALMWANHDWYDRHPVGRDIAKAPMLYQWSSTRESVGFVWDYIIENYMTRANYWRIDDLPYFSIYATNRFITQMGGVAAAADVLADFRERAKKAGLPGIHINAVWYDNLDSAPQCPCPCNDWYTKVGFSSYTSYNCLFSHPLWEKFPIVTFQEAAEEYLNLMDKAINTLPGPYLPVATVGWDSSPRTIQSETYTLLGYPYLPIMNPDPKAFAKLLSDLGKRNPPAIFINAWNEWTEGSYLEPDMDYGMANLEAIKEFVESYTKIK
jgi:hypothetical protein